MDSWDIALLDVEPHRPAVLRSDGETRVIAINLPAGRSSRSIRSTSARGWSSPVGRSRSPRASRRVRRRRPAGALRSERAPRGPRQDRLAPRAAALAVARRGAPEPAERIAAILSESESNGSVAKAQDPPRRGARAAVCLAAALIYTSFSASTEASKPSELQPGRSYELTGKVVDGSVRRAGMTCAFASAIATAQPPCRSTTAASCRTLPRRS